MNRLILFLISIPFIVSCGGQKKDRAGHENEFSFVYMTDIHIKPENGVPQMFRMAIDTANKLQSDFVMTGGDLVVDVMRGNLPRADSLFRLYLESIKAFNMPVYNCMGNHDMFGIYEVSGVSPSDPDFKYGMYKRYLGDTYYSFDHKGWHFIVLNDLDIDEQRRYVAVVNDEVLAWLKDDLSKVDKNTPISVTSHMQLFSTINEVHGGMTPRHTVSNRYEVMEIFKEHNLRLLLHGHIHWLEDVYLNGNIHFITGGAVSGDTWKGTKYIDKGFLKINIKGENVTWQYIHYDKNEPVKHFNEYGMDL